MNSIDSLRRIAQEFDEWWPKFQHVTDTRQMAELAFTSGTAFGVILVKEKMEEMEEQECPSTEQRTSNPTTTKG